LKGVSGNPAGKRPGTRNRATVAAEALLDGEAEALTRRAIELGKQGDITALRLCLDRVIAPRRERPMRFQLPALHTPGDAAGAMAAIAEAVANGELSALEASELAKVLESFAGILEGHRSRPAPDGALVARRAKPSSKARRRRTKRPAARPRTAEDVKAANLADPFHSARIARLNSGERFDDPNGPSDDRWPREVFVHPDCEGGSHWLVKWGDRDGGCYVTTFDGPMAEQRARDYYRLGFRLATL
jgi:hypothetical protein